MAKPRVFVSSTYYDLRHIRNSLERFIEGLGYDPILFEKGHVAFQHDAPLDESCYQEIHTCHMLVMIIGGRYGSPASDTAQPKKGEAVAAPQEYNSITKKEYEEARERDIPIFIFVEKNVLSEYETFKKNRKHEGIDWMHVDTVNVFHLLDDILAQPRNNLVRPFETFDDIASWLRDQWAGLFSESLSRSRAAKSFNDLAAQLGELRQVVTVLKTYSESIMHKVEVDNLAQIIEVQTQKLREVTVGRFRGETLVEALVHWHKFDNPGNAMSHSNEEIYEAFQHSQTLDEFVVKAGLAGAGANLMKSHWRVSSENLWNLLKAEYR